MTATTSTATKPVCETPALRLGIEQFGISYDTEAAIVMCFCRRERQDHVPGQGTAR